MARLKARPLTGWGVVLLFGMVLTFGGVIVLADEGWLRYAGREAEATVVEVKGWRNRGGEQRYTYTYRYRDEKGAEEEGWALTPGEAFSVGQKLTVTYLNGWSRVKGTEGRPWVFFVLGLGVMGVAGVMRVMAIGRAPMGGG